MTMKLHTAAGDGLFDLLGPLCAAIDTLNTARKTTVPVKMEAFVLGTQHQADWPLELEDAIAGTSDACRSWQSSGSTITSSLQTVAQRLLTQFVAEDSPKDAVSVRSCLEYLIAQMVARGSYVDSDGSFGFSGGWHTAGANSGALRIYGTSLGSDGRYLENSIDETLGAAVIAPDGTILVTSQPAVDLLSQDWPAGSGVNLRMSPTSAANSLILNGDFEDTTIANIPDNWRIAAGTPGTQIFVTNPEQQTVAVANATGGYWLLSYTNARGIVRTTNYLSYDASAGAVQAALRMLPGLENVTVTRAGTTTLTYTIVFVGVAGNVAALTYKSFLTGSGPTITVSESVAGVASLNGKSLQLNGASGVAPELYQPLTLSPGVLYLACVWMKYSGTYPAAGSVVLELKEGASGSVLNSGGLSPVSSQLSLAAASLDTSWVAYLFPLFVPPDTTQPVALHIRIDGTLTSGSTVWLDELAIAPARQLYPGGPNMAAFASGLAPSLNDKWTMTVTRDITANLWQTWFNRLFNMAGFGMLLPTAAASGSSSAAMLIPDTLISP